MVILIDTNVIIDFLTSREPFYTEAERILTWCAQRKIIGFIAAHSFSNCFYILRKNCTAKERKDLLRNLLKITYVAGIDEKIIINALENDAFTDFEDCIQFECAKPIAADYIVTRNTNDFPTTEVKIVTPTEFISLFE